MITAKELLEVYNVLDWEHYIAITNGINKIDKFSIDNDLMNQPSLYSYYNGLLAIAKKELDEANLDLEQYISKTRKAEHESKLNTGGKATDKYLESFVLSQEEYCNLNRVVIDKQFKHNLLRALVQAMETKKDCLIQLSANQRAEIKLSN